MGCSAELELGFAPSELLPSTRADEISREAGEGSPGGAGKSKGGFALSAMHRPTHAICFEPSKRAAWSHNLEKSLNLSMESAQR